MNESTIQFYNEHAGEYAEGTINADMAECRIRFLKYITPGAKILDAGCGSGRDTIAFLSAGYEVDAFDASEKMCRIASEKTGINVENRRFEELEGSEKYDGIWACASLLHVKKEKLPDVLSRLNQLLKQNGVLYVSFKYGDKERVDEERYFCDLTEDECCSLVQQAGFSVLETFLSGDVLPDRKSQRWVNAIGRK